MPENCRDMHKDPMIRSDGLSKGRSESASPRMKAGEPLEGRSNGNNKVSISHRCSGQVLDYSACWPVLAQSILYKRKALAQEAAQWSLDASVSLTIVHD